MKDFDELLATWEGTSKKGLLTFWMLLALYERETYAFEMAALVSDISRGTLTADEQSIYRALNRFEDLGIVASSRRESPKGPPRRYYRLTPLGLALLRAFTERNILVFQKEGVADRIQRLLGERLDSQEGKGD